MASGRLHAVSLDEATSDSRLKYVILFGGTVLAGVALYWYTQRRKAAQKPATKNTKSAADVRADAAQKIADQISSQDPCEKANGYKNKGNNLFKQKHYKDAVECYSDAIKVCPVDKKEMLATFYQNRAAAYENLNMTENVLKDCTKALEFNKKYSKAYFRRAKAFETQGELRKCLEDATCCSMLEQFQHLNALQLADKVLKAHGAQKAKEIYASRTPQLPSSSFLRNYLRSFVEDPIVMDLAKRKNNEPLNSSGPPTGYDEALQALIEEKWEDVVGHCNDEVTKGSDKEKVDKSLVLRAGFYIISGQVDLANKDIEMLLNRENVDVKVKVNALIKKATAEIHKEQTAEALATFEKAIELDPNNADIYLHRGQVFLLLDKMDQTLKSFELSSSLRPDFVSAAAQLAYTQYRCGSRFGDRQQQDDAMKKFEECMLKFPDAAEVYFLYAQLMMELEKYDFAEKYLNMFIEKDPQDPTGLVHLGILHLQSKQMVDKAINLMQQAMDIDPKCQFAYETLGTMMMQIGRTADGIALLDKAIGLAQTEGEIAHLYALKTSAEIQVLAVERFGAEMPLFPMGLGV